MAAPDDPAEPTAPTPELLAEYDRRLAEVQTMAAAGEDYRPKMADLNKFMAENHLAEGNFVPTAEDVGDAQE